MAVPNSDTAPPGCPDVVRLFSRHLEGDVTAPVCARMEEHLTGCAVCRTRCESLRRSVALCRRAGEGTVPVATQHLVRAALRRARERILAAASIDDGSGS
jgi:RNA polymerase sigma-70 factor (ECF subfamily)